jgi:hypothetical protein
MAVASPGLLLNIVTDFLANSPSAEAIIAFRLPDYLEDRAIELLERNRHGILTESERNELDEFARMEQFMTILKVKSRHHLSATP